MTTSTSLQTNVSVKTAITLGGHQMLGLKILAKSLPELRTEVIREIESNPVLEDVDHPLERTMSEVERERDESGANLDRDFPEEDFTPLSVRDDEDAIERRQALFDNQTARETLQAHLMAQLPTSDIDKRDYALAETLIGDIDSNGYYRGSLPDLCMAFECAESKVLDLLKQITEFDPAGCGARTARECLLVQVDSIENQSLRQQVIFLIDHLEDLALGKFSDPKHADAIKALKTLDPHPGRAYLSEKDRVEYINPEIHACQDETGHWCALTDKRSLPEIRVSKRFEAMLADPNQSAETKAYVKERIEHAQAIREAVANRQATIEAIAQAIFDRQQEFFAHGLKALKPMTELEIAREIGVVGTTVSRTVRDKYAQTPQGTFELRRFFTSGVVNADGETISQNAVLDQLRKIIDAEDKANPLSDEKLSAAMKAAGYPVARRTIAKYRGKLNLPEAAARRL